MPNIDISQISLHNLQLKALSTPKIKQTNKVNKIIYKVYGKQLFISKRMQPLDEGISFFWP